MDVCKVFKRYELKYLIDSKQKAELAELIKERMIPDPYGRSRINNLYFDTKDQILIRRSLERPVYKEKLRLRFYGETDDPEKMYLELKKKYDGVVYKRRLSLAEFLDPARQPQITREIRYFRRMYPGLKAAAFISYDREAWFGKDDPDLRITFDSDIRYSDLADHPAIPSKGWAYLSLTGEAGEALIPKDAYLMEIKTRLGLPRFILDFLNRHAIRKTSFSKYGCGYKKRLAKARQKGGAKIAAPFSRRPFELEVIDGGSAGKTRKFQTRKRKEA